MQSFHFAAFPFGAPADVDPFTPSSHGDVDLICLERFLGAFPFETVMFIMDTHMYISGIFETALDFCV